MLNRVLLGLCVALQGCDSHTMYLKTVCRNLKACVCPELIPVQYEE